MPFHLNAETPITLFFYFSTSKGGVTIPRLPDLLALCTYYSMCAICTYNWLCMHIYIKKKKLHSINLVVKIDDVDTGILYTWGKVSLISCFLHA